MGSFFFAIKTYVLIVTINPHSYRRKKMANKDVLCMWMDSVDNRLELLRKADKEQQRIIELQHKELELFYNVNKLLDARIRLLEDTIMEMKGE